MNLDNHIASYRARSRCIESGTGCRRKRKRAYGGCLGAKSRRRTRPAAISPGEPLAGFDPGISEWGNPARVMPCHPRKRRGTGGTETSKYPEEEKSTEIPQVAASERGTAQTPGILPGGLRKGATESLRHSGTRMESRTKEGESPVREMPKASSLSRVPRDTPTPREAGGTTLQG